MRPARSPADQLRDMLASLGATGKRLGIETNAYGLTHFNGKAGGRRHLPASASWSMRPIW